MAHTTYDWQFAKLPNLTRARVLAKCIPDYMDIHNNRFYLAETIGAKEPAKEQGDRTMFILLNKVNEPVEPNEPMQLFMVNRESGKRKPDTFIWRTFEYIRFPPRSRLGTATYHSTAH